MEMLFMNKVTIKKVCLLLLLGGLAPVSSEVQAVTKTKMLTRDPLWQMVLATKKFATPYMKDLLIKVPQLQHPATPYALGAAGLATLLGIYAARRPLKQQAEKGWGYVKWGYNQLPWPLQVLVAAPVGVVGGTLAAHYSSIIAPDKATGAFLKKTVFLGAFTGILYKMTDARSKIQEFLSSESQNPADKIIGSPTTELYDPDLDDAEKINPNELIASCGEVDLKNYITDLANQKCKNLLLFGQSNTGKTTFVTDLCAALNIKALITQATELNAEIYVGSGEKKIKELLEKINDLPANTLVVIDEADNLLKASADYGQSGHQTSMNKMMMKILDTAHTKKLRVIMITNIRNPKEIPATIVNRFTRVTKKSLGGYIVEKGLPNLLGRQTICEKIVREAIKYAYEQNNQNYLLPDLGSFSLYIAKYTAGCNNGEIVSIVRRIIEYHEKYASYGQTAIISVKSPFSLSIINQAIRENSFDGLDQMIDFLAGIERAASDKKDKERIQKAKERYEKELEESTKLRSTLILSDYSTSLLKILSSKGTIDSKIEQLETTIVPDLENALHPHKQRLEGLSIDCLKCNEQIITTDEKLTKSKTDLFDTLTKITNAYPQQTNQNLHNAIVNFKKSIEVYLEEPVQEKREAICNITNDLKNKVKSTLEAGFTTSVSTFYVNGMAYEKCIKSKDNTSKIIENLKEQETKLQDANKNTTAILNAILEQKISNQEKIESINKIVKDANLQSTDTSSDAYKKLCRLYKAVKVEYEKYKYHLPLMSRDDLLRVAQEVQRELDYETCEDWDIKKSNHDQIILNKLGVTVDKTSFGSTLKSITINTLKTTWNCATYPFTPAKQRRTYAARIGNKIERHGLSEELDALTLPEETLSADPITSKEQLQKTIVKTFLATYKESKSSDNKSVQKILEAFNKEQDLHIRKGRDKILEVSADGKTFVSLNTISDECEKNQIKEAVSKTTHEV